MDEREMEVVTMTIDENNDVSTDIVSVEPEKLKIGAGEAAIMGLAGAGVIYLATLAYKGGKKLVTWTKDKFGKKQELTDVDEDFEEIGDEIQEELKEDLNKKK